MTWMTELRQRFNGSRWAGPMVEAESREAADTLMADSPYVVIGELVGTERVDADTIHRFVVPRGVLKVH